MFSVGNILGNYRHSALKIQNSTLPLRQGLKRIARKGGGRWAAGAAERPEGAPDRDYAAHGLPTADYERKARRRACEPGRPKNKKAKKKQP